MDVDEDVHTQCHVDHIDAAACHEHLKTRGIEVPAGSEDGEAEARREQLNRHLATARSIAEKLTTSV